MHQYRLEASEKEWVNSQNYAIIQSSQWFSELTHSSSEASNYKKKWPNQKKIFLLDLLIP